MICHNCKAELAGKPKFCPHCGTGLLPPVEPQPATKRCPQCGTENHIEAKFCKHDGYHFAIPEEVTKTDLELPDYSQADYTERATRAPVENSPHEADLFSATEKSEEPEQTIETDSLRICPTCSTANASNARYCKSDGTPLTPSATPSYQPTFIEAAVVMPTSAPEETPSHTVKQSLGQQPKVLATITVLIVGLAAVGYFFVSRDDPAHPEQSANRSDGGPPPGRASDHPQTTSPPTSPVQPSTQRDGARGAGQSPEPPTYKTAVTPEGRVDAASVHQDLTAQLRRAGLANVELTVDSEGRAGMAGTVSSIQQKEKAIHLALAQSGIEFVNADDLMVEPSRIAATQPPVSSVLGKSITPIDSAKLEGEINRSLRAAGLGGIAAQVSDDLTVTLRGSVTSDNQKARAFQIAKSFGGVKNTKDRIFVVN